MPAPVAALYHVSWNLETMHDDDFDPVLALELLENFDLFEWPSRQPISLPSTGNPLEALQVMKDFYLETHNVANLLGQCMIIRVERFLNPHACILPIFLSNTELTRIACTLWTLKIYYQLLLKFSNQPTEYAVLSDTFARGLGPWQVYQGLSLRGRLLTCCDDYIESLDHYDETESSLLKLLAESRFVNDFIESVRHARGPSGFIHPFSAAGEILSREGHVSRRTNMWLHDSSSVGHPSGPSSTCTQLRNHAWNNHEPTLHTVTAAHTNRYMSICRHLGLFFWDYARLSHWQISETNQLMAAADMYPGLSAVAVRYNYRPSWSLGLFEDAVAVERNTQRQVTEWTRCTEQQTPEEWLYHKTAHLREKEGLPPVPRKFIELGTKCVTCGLDGHRYRHYCMCDPPCIEEGVQEPHT